MRRLLAVAVLVACTAAPPALRAQGDEAPPPARGVVRVLLPPVWGRWNQRFGEGTSGSVTGRLEPLGVDVTTDTLSATQVPFLGPSQALLRVATGIAGYALNLGSATLQLNANVRAQPLGLAVGLSRRLSVSVLVPLVRSRMETFFRLDTTGAFEPTVGWNPAHAAPGSADAFRAQVDAALAALRTQAASGPVALRPQAQAALDQSGPFLCALYATTGGAGANADPLCAAVATGPPAAFLPLAGSTAGESLTGRLAAARANWSQLSSAYAAAGVTLPMFTAGFGLPSDPIDRAGLQQFLRDSVAGAGGDSLGMALRTRLGDIEAAATYVLADRGRLRGFLTARVRLPTGFVDSERDFVDVGTGDHQLDVEIGGRGVVALGPSFEIGAGVRAAVQMADQLPRRVSPANAPIAPLWQRALVRRDLGDYVALDVTPTWRLDDAFSLGIRYALFRQGAARFTYVDAADSATTGLSASVLDQETAVRWMRVGAVLTFSTLGRYAEGRASAPYTLTVGYQNTLWGRGGRTPQASLVYISLAAYVRAWGTGSEMAAGR